MSEDIIEITFCKYCDAVLEDPIRNQKYCNTECRRLNFNANRAGRKQAGSTQHKTKVTKAEREKLPEWMLVRGEISTLRGGFTWK